MPRYCLPRLLAPLQAVANWRGAELELLSRTHDAPDTQAWWSELNGTGEAVTKRQTFPHMSQRVMWCEHILAAAQLHLPTIETHICEQTFAALQ